MKNILSKAATVSYIDKPVERSAAVRYAYKIKHRLENWRLQIGIMLNLVSFFIRNHRNMAKIIQTHEQKMHDAKFAQKVDDYHYWKGFVDGLKFTIE